MQNKRRYEAEVRAPLEALVVDLSAALEERAVPLRGEPKSSFFRIYRDVRFSKDKTPYKTHASAVLSKGGVKGLPGILYLHFAPGQCMVAAGFYHPEAKTLAQIRNIIIEGPAVWRSVTRASGQAGLALGSEDVLIRVPRGFESVKDPDLIDALRLKFFVVRKDMPQALVQRRSLIGDLADFAENVMPLLGLI